MKSTHVNLKAVILFFSVTFFSAALADGTSNQNPPTSQAPGMWEPQGTSMVASIGSAEAEAQFNQCLVDDGSGTGGTTDKKLAEAKEWTDFSMDLSKSLGSGTQKLLEKTGKSDKVMDEIFGSSDANNFTDADCDTKVSLPEKLSDLSCPIQNEESLKQSLVDARKNYLCNEDRFKKFQTEINDAAKAFGCMKGLLAAEEANYLGAKNFMDGQVAALNGDVAELDAQSKFVDAETKEINDTLTEIGNLKLSLPGGSDGKGLEVPILNNGEAGASTLKNYYRAQIVDAKKTLDTRLDQVQVAQASRCMQGVPMQGSVSAESASSSKPKVVDYFGGRLQCSSRGASAVVNVTDYVVCSAGESIRNDFKQSANNSDKGFENELAGVQSNLRDSLSSLLAQMPQDTTVSSNGAVSKTGFDNLEQMKQAIQSWAASQNFKIRGKPVTLGAINGKNYANFIAQSARVCMTRAKNNVESDKKDSTTATGRAFQDIEDREESFKQQINSQLPSILNQIKKMDAAFTKMSPATDNEGLMVGGNSRILQREIAACSGQSQTEQKVSCFGTVVQHLNQHVNSTPFPIQVKGLKSSTGLGVCNGLQGCLNVLKNHKDKTEQLIVKRKGDIMEYKSRASNIYNQYVGSVQQQLKPIADQVKAKISATFKSLQEKFGISAVIPTMKPSPGAPPSGPQDPLAPPAFQGPQPSFVDAMMVSQQMPDLNNPEAVKGFQEELKTKATELQKSMKELNNSEQDLMNSITTCKGKQDEKDERSAKSVIEGLTKSLDSCATMLKLSDANSSDALGTLVESLRDVLTIRYQRLSGSEGVSDALAGIAISAETEEKRQECSKIENTRKEGKLTDAQQVNWDNKKCDKLKNDLKDCATFNTKLEKKQLKIDGNTIKSTGSAKIE